jgi:hypothetical protein
MNEILNTFGPLAIGGAFILAAWAGLRWSSRQKKGSSYSHQSTGNPSKSKRRSQRLISKSKKSDNTLR